MNALPRTRVVVTLAAILWLAHVAVVAGFGANPPGPIYSELIQLTLGTILIYAIHLAGKASEGLPRSFWRLAAAAYVLWFIAESLGLYNDFFPSSTAVWISNMLFCFWFVPLAMALFLDPEREAGRLDALVALDFVQAVLFCVAAYLYFFLSSPKRSRPANWPTRSGLLTSSATDLWPGVRSARRRQPARATSGSCSDGWDLLAFSGCVDAVYDYGPGAVQPRHLVRSSLERAAGHSHSSSSSPGSRRKSADLALETPRREKRIYTEIFFLLYPLLVLFMSLRIARERLGLAAAVVLLSFVCSSARLLVTQTPAALAKEALRREASRDGLTSLWNRKAILAILERDLLRAERDHRARRPDHDRRGSLQGHQRQPRTRRRRRRPAHHRQRDRGGGSPLRFGGTLRR